jgi:hypothetical protein
MKLRNKCIVFEEVLVSVGVLMVANSVLLDDA